MTCECRVCVRHREYSKHITDIKDAGLDGALSFVEEMYDTLNNVELNNNVNQAIIEGSWPTADENIKCARERYQSKLNG